MTGTWTEATVVVRPLPSGVIRIGPFIANTAGVTRLVVPGGVAIIDPMTPHSPPTLEISEASEADPFLRDLFGDPTADQVASLENALPPTGEPDVVPAVFNPRLHDLTRLGQLIWLIESTPWPWPIAVPAAELITTAHACLDLLDDAPEISDALVERAPAISTALTTATTATTCPDTVKDLLLHAAQAIRWYTPAASALAQELDQAIAAATRIALAPAATTLPVDLSDLWDACTTAAPVHAGTRDDAMVVGTTSAHWDRNTPGLVSRTEEAVLWDLHQRRDGTLHVSIVVTGAGPTIQVCDPALPDISVTTLIAAITAGIPAPVAHASTCSIHTPSWPLPWLEVTLNPVPGTGNLAADAILQGPAVQAISAAVRTGTLIVDVHDAGTRFAHLLGGDPAVDAARRWSARAVCATRLALATGDPETRRSAANAWTRAIAVWTHTGTLTDPALADERVRQCRGWADLLTARTDVPVPPSQDVVRAVTRQDTTGLGFTLTTTEQLTGQFSLPRLR